MKKIKLAISFIILAAAILAIIFLIIPEKLGRRGFINNAESYLEGGGLLRDTEDKDFKVIEYADAEYQGRKVKGAIVRATYVLVDRAQGVKENKCFYVPAIFDKKFDVYRSIQLIECEDADVIEIPRWKSAYKFGGYTAQNQDLRLVRGTIWKRICLSRELPGRMEYKKVTLNHDQQIEACRCIATKNPDAVHEMIDHPNATYPIKSGDGSGPLLMKYVDDVFSCISS